MNMCWRICTIILKIVYKYKYFETSYNLFDEYKSLDEIKQISNDKFVLAYLEAEIFRNYLHKRGKGVAG